MDSIYLSKVKKVTLYYIVDEKFLREEVAGRYDIQHRLEGYRVFADKDYNIQEIESLDDYHIDMEILLNTVFVTNKEFLKDLDNTLAQFMLENE